MKRQLHSTLQQANQKVNYLKRLPNYLNFSEWDHQRQIQRSTMKQYQCQHKEF